MRQRQESSKLCLVTYNSSYGDTSTRFHIFLESKDVVLGEELVWKPSNVQPVCNGFDLDDVNGNCMVREFPRDVELSELEEFPEDRLGEICEHCVNRFKARRGDGV